MSEITVNKLPLTGRKVVAAMHTGENLRRVSRIIRAAQPISRVELARRMRVDRRLQPPLIFISTASLAIA